MTEKKQLSPIHNYASKATSFDDTRYSALSSSDLDEVDIVNRIEINDIETALTTDESDSSVISRSGKTKEKHRNTIAIPKLEKSSNINDLYGVDELSSDSSIDSREQDDRIALPLQPSTKDSDIDDDSSGPAKEHSVFQIIIAWLSMFLALIASASVGPAFRYMMVAGVLPLLAAAWRSQTMIICLSPLAMIEAFSKKENQVKWFGYKPDLPFPVIVHVFISGTAWSAGLLFWIIGLKFISTYKGAVVATCHPILLVFTLRCSGQEVSLGEWFGVFIAFSGVIVSNFSEFFEKSNTSEDTTSTTQHYSADMSRVPIHLQFFGFFLCLLSASGEVVVIMNRIKTRKYVPLFQYTLGTTIVVALYSTVSSLLLEGTKVFTRESNIDNGYSLCTENDCLFGWTSEGWRWKMLIFGLWVGAVCITGFNYAMSYIPPLVFSSISLLDPAITAFLSWTIGLEGLPTIFSGLGGVVVIGGVALITHGERQRELKHRHSHKPALDSSQHELLPQDDLEEDDEVGFAEDNEEMTIELSTTRP